MSGVQVVFGGSDAKNGDYSRLHQLAKGERTWTWSCPKLTKAGDTLLFYVERPHSAIIATATALKDAAAGEHWRYVTRIGKINILKEPITLAEMRRMFPRWRWLNYPRAYTYLSEGIAERLLRRAKHQPPPPEVKLSVRGAGFGTAKENKAVEMAACRHVERHYRSKGFKLTSREAEKVGYDFDAVRNGTTLHVEVKGVSGSLVAFPITVNEVNRARKDRQFRLAVVTAARSKTPRLHEFTGPGFLKSFNRTPLAFMAKLT